MSEEVYFWLCSFPNDFKHQKISQLGSRHHKLGLPPWMSQRLNLESGSHRFPSLPTRCVLALCKGRFAGVWAGPLTQIGVEEALLMKFWHYPTDAWFLSFLPLILQTLCILDLITMSKSGPQKCRSNLGFAATPSKTWIESIRFAIEMIV